MNSSCEYSFENFEIKLPSSILGICISSIGILANLAILLIFAKMTMKSANITLLQALAVCDIFMLILYILMIPLKSISEYLRFFTPYLYWMRSIKVLFPVSRTTQMLASYVTLLAALERTVSLKNWHGIFLGRKIYAWLLAVLIFCVGSHISRFWEPKVTRNPDCNYGQFGYLEIQPSNLLRNKLYRTVYSFWYTNLTDILTPFVILLILAIIMTYQFRRLLGKGINRLLDHGFMRPAYERRVMRVRDSSKVMITLVFTQEPSKLVGHNYGQN